MSDDENPREELYQRFRESLRRPVSERFFDEDELVEVYDYAGDLNDDYVQMEVLFCGARLYPESQALSERRALLYLDTSIDDTDAPSPAAGEYINDNFDTFSPIFDIVRLETEQPYEPQEALEFLLTQYETFNDEEMIRFCDLALDLGQYNWLKENLTRLKDKTDNKDIVHFELMNAAEENGDNDMMARMAEELIESEPFNVGYWHKLFRAQARAEKTEEARNTFDYAAALSQDDADVLLSLASDVYAFAPFLYKEAYDMLEGVREKSPDVFTFLDCQCAILIRSGMGDKAVHLLMDYATAHPNDPMVLRQLLLCNIREAGEFIDRYFAASGNSSLPADIYSELINTLTLHGGSRSLVAILERNNPPTLDENDFAAYIEALFSQHLYKRVTDEMEAYQYKALLEAMPLKGYAAAYAYIVSLLKTDRYDDARAYFRKIRPACETMMSEGPMPIRLSVRTILTLGDKMQRHPASEKLYWEFFDMLDYSKK